tara:strand:- start:746 stop:1483 length:738 start_codon:yes stop_codon:yes gene_type:complete
MAKRNSAGRVARLTSKNPEGIQGMKKMNIRGPDTTKGLLQLESSNPGARTRFRIVEGCVDFTSGSTNTIDKAHGVVTQGVTFSGSIAIPRGSKLDALTIRMGNTLTGSNALKTGNLYISKVGLTASHGSALTDVSDVDHFYLNATAYGSDAYPMPLSSSGMTAVYFPQQTFYTSGSKGGDIAFGTERIYTGFTGSSAADTVSIYFEVTGAGGEVAGKAIDIGTGSLTYAMHLTTFAPPTSSGSAC